VQIATLQIEVASSLSPTRPQPICTAAAGALESGPWFSPEMTCIDANYEYFCTFHHPCNISARQVDLSVFYFPGQRSRGGAGHPRQSIKAIQAGPSRHACKQGPKRCRRHFIPFFPLLIIARLPSWAPTAPSYVHTSTSNPRARWRMQATGYRLQATGYRLQRSELVHSGHSRREKPCSRAAT
jgi:hypothetical protein